MTFCVAFRTTYKNECFEREIQLLKPVSLDLEIQRNLSSSWYHKIPDIEIGVHLKPMSVSTAEEGIFVLIFFYIHFFPETSLKTVNCLHYRFISN